mmetsp:Transcript_14486/g.21362  ORF Transcript_14486/g.21362 Transcript_14486/m.21362 type:complete len:203 (-) Transcript_14486:1328-1936(-)|eukprot:CAMPEP_0195544056 /NCGR_PEP_ID=MMETSP0794_2-20130614/52433_1 /TAXON_ID=515487 /ORGANISM="Stephanopyxis turris, Strain CCMP 815" /LENGTH=202 /DNA_ID=CAMNT_0040678233 /DNA_START=147 /DNA_END=755 /DNA_ORIENTATION=-
MNRVHVHTFPFPLRAIAVLFSLLPSSLAFSVGATSQVFGIPSAGWTSPEWRWGEPSGMSHDCASQCRERFRTIEQREHLVDSLVNIDEDTAGTDDGILSFEEIKLVLALAWQKARKNGFEGEAYGVILDQMTEAERYESGDDEATSRLFVQDVQKRFFWLEPEVEDKIAMTMLWYDTEDYDVARRRCGGLVLKAIGFIEDGL